MKRIFSLIFLILLLTASFSFAESSPVDLSTLTASELTIFIEDINAAIERHHEPDSTAREVSLNTTKKYVESYFTKQGIDVSWAWFNYTYTKDWDFYTVSTHIDYEDANEKSHTDDVYAELFPDKGQHAIYYLLVGTEVLINRRDELPEKQWIDTPESIINSATNTELATFTRDELKSLKRSVEKEYSDHHEPEYSTSNLVLSLTEAAVEQHLGSQGFSVSWAWFDYAYTREWDFYTLTTPITYRNENTSHKSTVYAEAYPQSSQYALVYLSIDDDVLLDKRDQVPSILSSSAVRSSPAPIVSESTPTVDPTSAQFETVILDSQGNEITFLSDAPAMTIENSDEFAKVLSVKNPADPIVERFAVDHSADLIEFDGHIAYIAPHGNYNTRYDILIYAGDYNENGTGGPNFQFSDVNAFDMGLDSLFLSDVLNVNDNVHVIALVDQYNSKTELLKLMPLQVTVSSSTSPSSSISDKMTITQTPASEPTPAPFEAGILDSTDIDASTITTDNSEEFKKVLAAKSPSDSIIERFAAKHRTDLIEFDGYIAYISSHEGAKTRYDILIYAGNYGEKGLNGPNFQFSDVSTFDMGLDSLFLSDVLNVNDNVHVIASVDQYNSKTELFRLKPQQVTVRTSASVSTAYETLKPGSKGQAVLDARMKLYELGYFRKKPTQTEYTNNMMDYVKKFEKDYGLVQDGILSPEDLTVLYNASK